MSKIDADEIRLEPRKQASQHGRMKIASWNVNSLNVRLPHVLEFLSGHQPDVLALQETKTPDEKFPVAAIGAAGYQALFSGQKAYNGVAILSRRGATECVTDVPELDDPQRRMLAATAAGVRVINVYVPNGQEVGSEKYAYKFRWLHAFTSFLKAEIAGRDRLIVLGDFNIAPADQDIHDPARWHEKIMCSTPERKLFQAMLNLGLVDTVRRLHPDEPMFSWWDYRMNAFKRRWGIRIDHVLATESMQPLRAGVDAGFRALERPSDHAPVWVEFN
jgi:exodeoxyribonuclease-3